MTTQAPSNQWLGALKARFATGTIIWKRSHTESLFNEIERLHRELEHMADMQLSAAVNRPAHEPCADAEKALDRWWTDPSTDQDTKHVPAIVWKAAWSAARAAQPPEVRCACGAHEWPNDCVQIEDSRGRLHTLRGCQPGATATKEPSRDLLTYGYAPGNYMSNCLTCGQNMQDVDKRCRTCQACAEKKMRTALGERNDEG